jgi:DnaK suppressor protein
VSSRCGQGGAYPSGRLEDNTYGYCEETGEPISLMRLEARPIATLSVEAQERQEKREKLYRDE